MLAEQLAAAVAGARRRHDLDRLAAILWRALAEGHLTEPAAEAISEAVEAKRAAFGSGQRRPLQAASEPRRAQRSPDRERSIRRRRGLAASGAMPHAIACHFTTAEAAALSVIAREFQRRGRCALPIDAIAAMAGTSRTSVQNAMRAARRLGLIAVEERRRAGARSDTNLIVVTEPEWLLWLKIGNSRQRVQKQEHHEKPIDKNSGGIPGIDRRIQLSDPGTTWRSPSVPAIVIYPTCRNRTNSCSENSSAS